MSTLILASCHLTSSVSAAANMRNRNRTGAMLSPCQTLTLCSISQTSLSIFRSTTLTQLSRHKDSMATSNFSNSFHGHCMAPFLPGEWLLQVKIVKHKTHNAMMFYLFSPQLDIGPAPLCVCASSPNIHPKACGTCVAGARFA